MMSRVLPIAFLLAAGAIFFGYIHPTVTGPIVSTNAQIKKYDSALKAAKRFDEKQKQLQAEQKRLPSDSVARLESFLPDGVDNVQLILDLDGLATRSGINLGNFNTTEANKTSNSPVDKNGNPVLALNTTKPYDSLDLSMTATGSYAALRTFLAGVETSLRPLDLVEFHLSDSITGVYTYQMTFRLYSLH
jgi:hypothetical protein